MHMKIVKSISLFTISLLILVTSCEDDTLSTVGSISVSQGTNIGVVHVNWDPSPEAAYYNIERKGPNGAWIAAGTVNAPPFDDYGFGLPDNRLVEGAKYTYRISSASGDAGDSPFSEPTGEGWIYEFQPIAMQAVRQEDGTIVLSWTDTTQNLVNQSNLSSFKYIIKRRYEDETSFKDLFTTDFMSNVQTMNYTDDGVTSDKKAFYDIQGRYQYVYKNMDMGSYEAI